MWPVAKSGEPKAKRMRRDVAFGEEENPLSRGPSGPLRSSKSGKLAPLLSRRPVTYWCALERLDDIGRHRGRGRGRTVELFAPHRRIEGNPVDEQRYRAVAAFQVVKLRLVRFEVRHRPSLPYMTNAPLASG